MFARGVLAGILLVVGGLVDWIGWDGVGLMQVWKAETYLS